MFEQGIVPEMVNQVVERKAVAPDVLEPTRTLVTTPMDVFNEVLLKF